MRNQLVVLSILAASAAPVAANAAGWNLERETNATALAIGTPATDRDAFRIECSGSTMTLSTWAGSPPRGVTEGTFPTQLSVFFGRTELVITAAGRVTGPGGTTRIDARLADPASFLTSLGQVNRLTTVIFAGRRMAATPSSAQIADFRKACGV